MNASEQSSIPGFRFVPRTGVIYVMHEATGHGFSYDDPHWANLGQGSPETGIIAEAPPRIESVTIAGTQQQYAPVAGNKDSDRNQPSRSGSGPADGCATRYGRQARMLRLCRPRVLDRAPRSAGQYAHCQ